MHEKDDSAVPETKFSTTNNQKPALNIEIGTDHEDYLPHRHDTRNADFQDDDKHKNENENGALLPQIVFKRTADMIGQQHLQRRISGGGTSPGTAGDVPMSGMSVLGTAHQEPSLDKLGGETNAETLSKSGHQVIIPLRPARVHKAPRQSRLYSSSKSTLSEYTTHLMYMEAFNQKHLKDDNSQG